MLTTSKPRISLYTASRRWKGMIWKCVGDGRQGMGTDPTDAYWDWYSFTQKVW